MGFPHWLSWAMAAPTLTYLAVRTFKMGRQHASDWRRR